MIGKKLYSVISATYTTEKSVKISEKNKHITFKVNSKSNKHDIKIAVEKIFSVVVDKVCIIKVKKKLRKFKQTVGYKRGWKKAIISLRDGHDINISEFK